MRSFLLVANMAVTKPFNLNGLPNAGRMDLVCRCVAQALFISHGIRKNVHIYVLLLGPPDQPKALLIKGDKVRSMAPDERNIGGIIRKALDIPSINMWRESTTGVYVAKKDIDLLLKDSSSPIVYLCEEGTDIRTVASKLSDGFFILGDHQGLTCEQKASIRDHVDHTVSVSPNSLQADQCITIVHNELDRMSA